MKALPKKLLPLTLFAIAVTSVFCVQPAQGFTMTLQQVGSNVVANGSGPINLTGLTFVVSGTLEPGVIVPNIGIIQIGGSLGNPFIDQYTGITGPTSFGSGDTFEANTTAETLSAFSALPGILTCHRAMSPILLYRIA